MKNSENTFVMNCELNHWSQIIDGFAVVKDEGSFI